jgi:hypothetical protein
MMIASPTAASAAATVSRECDEREIHRIEHQLHAHEDDDRVSSSEHSNHSDYEQNSGERE